MAEEVSPENAGIWQQILSESTTAESASIEGRTILVLGDRNCGKTSLLSKFKNKDLHKDAKGLALDYTYLDVAEGEDVLTRVNVWQLEGEQHQSLLRFALNEENFHKTAVLIVLDFSKPWNLAQTLTAWFELLATHIKGLRLTSKFVEPSRNKLIRRFHNYQEPEEGAQKKKRMIELTTSSTPVRPDEDAEDDEVEPVVDEVPEIDDEHALTRNLGLPIVVACCKVDVASTLERNFHFHDDHFEFIQQHLRKLCIQYGAALVYTSTREEFNCDVTLEYLEHLLFDFDFVHRAQVLAKESLFVPIGWDSTEKIQVDFRNQQLCSDADQPFEEVVTTPSVVAEQETITPLVLPEDDQSFLERHRNAIEKQEIVKKKKEERDGPLQSPAAAAPTASPASTTATPDAKKEALKASFLEKMKSSSRTSSPAAASPAKTPTSGGSGINRDEMKSFFNNLLKKDKA